MRASTIKLVTSLSALAVLAAAWLITALIDHSAPAAAQPPAQYPAQTQPGLSTSSATVTATRPPHLDSRCTPHGVDPSDTLQSDYTLTLTNPTSKPVKVAAVLVDLEQGGSSLTPDDPIFGAITIQPHQSKKLHMSTSTVTPGTKFSCALANYQSSSPTGG